MMEREYFDRIYADSDDPWEFDTSWYERRKYAISLGLLTRSRYRRGLEPGCSHGAFTELLATRCDELISFDFHERSVRNARRRVRDRTHVEVRHETFPTFWPTGTGDLVVWSEVAYYLDEGSERDALDGLERWLEPEGDLLAVHYTGVTNYPLTGRAVTHWLDSVEWLERRALCVDVSFDAGVWTRLG